LSVDPLTDDYPWFTPYQFAGNNPIMSVDIDGLEPSENVNGNEKKENESSGNAVTGLLGGIGKGIWNAAERRIDQIQSLKTEEGRSNAIEGIKTGIKNTLSSTPLTVGIPIVNYLKDLPNKSPGQIGQDIGSGFYSGVNGYSDGVLLGGALGGSFKLAGWGFQQVQKLGLNVKLDMGVLNSGIPKFSFGPRTGSSILAKDELLRIENAATRINKPITVVGSRANGTAGAYSDWDYVIPGLNSRNWSKIKNSLPGSRSIMDNTPRNIDIFKGPVNPNLPHITIYPR
jgi:hypothetical protein